MFKRFKFRSRAAVLGIDISPTSVKVLEISTQGEKSYIEAYVSESLPETIVEAGAVVDGGALTSVIKKILAKINFSTKCAVLAIPDSMVICETIQLPDTLTHLEMEELVLHEAKKLIANPSEKISVDFAVLGASKEFFGMLDILLVISKAENIERRVKAVQDAGLKVKIVDLESYAITRAIAHPIAVASHLNLQEFTRVASSFLVAFGLALRKPYVS